MKTKIIKYKSSNGKQNIHAKLYYNEKSTKYNGVIQIIHGMLEHTHRYYHFAQYFVNNGYIVIINDHLGHGKSINTDTIHGHFADKNGEQYIVNDVYKLYKIAKQLYPNLPHFIYAHSMGGLIAINLLSKYKLDISGLVLLGSHLNQPLNYLFYSIVKTSSFFVKPTRPAKFFFAVQNTMFNVKFRKSTEGKSWINRKSDYILNTDFKDPEQFLFTHRAFQDLLKLSLKASPKALAKNLSKDTPIYLLTGSDDPVTNYTKLTRKKYNYLLKQNFTQVDFSEYKKARHNLIHEPNRDEVLYDILCFFDKVSNVYNL